MLNQRPQNSSQQFNVNQFANEEIIDNDGEETVNYLSSCCKLFNEV